MASPIRKKRMSLAEAEELARRDKKKIILMSVAMVIILAAFLYSQLDAANKRVAEESERDGMTSAIEEAAPVPGLPALTPEDEKPLSAIGDDSNEGKQTLDEGAVKLALEYANFWVPQHYLDAGTLDLDAGRAAEVLADPGARRLEPMRARGTVTRVVERQRSNANYPEYRGEMDLEGGGHAAFVVARPPADSGVEVGDFAMVQGLFLQSFRYEGDDGWIEAPLLCGKQIVPSYPSIDLEQGLATPVLSEVTDDRVGEPFGPYPQEAEWLLWARARAEDDGVDWANAPELNTETINAILEDGEAHRGQAFRVPISINQGARSLRIDENPLRLERMTEAWIGNQTWKSNSPVIKVHAPADLPELSGRARYGDARYLEAEVYFFRNFVFETSRGQPGRAPIFVARQLRAVVPEASPMPRRIMWAMLGVTGGLIALTYFLLRRDRAASQRLQEELVRRRRARRERQGAPAGGASDA